MGEKGSNICGCQCTNQKLLRPCLKCIASPCLKRITWTSIKGKGLIGLQSVYEPCPLNMIMQSTECSSFLHVPHTHIERIHHFLTTVCIIWLPENKFHICSPLYVAPCFLMKSEGTVGTLAKSSLFASSKVDGCTSKEWKQPVVYVVLNPDPPPTPFLLGGESGFEIWACVSLHLRKLWWATE